MRPLSRRALPLVAALLALPALVAGGCEGGGAKQTPGTSSTAAATTVADALPRTREEWIARADAYCEAGIREREALPKPATIEELATYAEAAAASLERENAAIRALRWAPGDHDLVVEFMNRRDRAPKAIRALAAYARAGDAASVAAGAIDPLLLHTLDEADEKAAAYGLAVCGSTRD